MEKKVLEEKLYSLVSILKPTQLAIEEGAKSDKQIIEEILRDVASEISKAREEGRREILEQFKNYWDNDYLGDYPKFGNAGIGMIKGEMRDYINEELSKLKQ